MSRAFMPRGTYFSPCREFRYTLWREWFIMSPGAPLKDTHRHFVQFVGLNPSTADETTDDRTVAKCVLFARRWGFGGMAMTNVFALRSTIPPVERFKDGSAIGPDNLAWVDAVAEVAGLIVCMWGDGANHLERGQYMADHLRQSHPHKLCTLATAEGAPLLNRSGHPTHPCRKSNSLTFAPWAGFPDKAQPII